MFQLGHLGRRFVHEQFDRVLIGQPVTAADGVSKMIFEAVVALDDCRGTAFSCHRMAAHRVDLAYQRNAEAGVDFGDGDGRPQPRTTSTDNHHVVSYAQWL